MTQEEKELLLMCLCARLPHKQKVCYKIHDNSDGITETLSGCLLDYFKTGKIAVVKPYLRSMSEMTDEERNELMDLCDITPYETQGLKIDEYGAGVFLNGICSVNSDVFDWVNANHFDYRGLIEKGLALEAPEGMY